RYPAKERTRVLLRLAELVEADAQVLGELRMLDTGATAPRARRETGMAVDLIRYYAGWPSKIEGSVSPTPDDLFAYVQREPVGVCVGITPFNAPLMSGLNKLLPALATGNVVILKP